ncbi:MAG: oligosaccharide flippase family protein [Pseudomonadota bacterium]
MKDLHAKIRFGSLVAIAANFVYLFSRLGITPFILSYVTLAAYGLWAFCFVVLSYAGMSAFGIHNSYIKYTAEYFHAQKLDKINGLFSTGLMVMGGYSILFFIVLVLASSWIIGLFDIDAELVPLARSLLIGTASVFLIDLTLGAFRAILEGLQEIALSKTIWLISTLLEVVLIVLFLRAGLGLMGVMYAYIMKTLVDVLAHILVAFRILPSLKIGISLVHKQYYRELFVFGGKVQVLGLLGMFLGSLDRIIITSILGLSATGLYEVGRKLPFTARSITGAASTPFLPAASAMKGVWRNKDGHELSNSHKIRGQKYIFNRIWHYSSLCITTTVVGIVVLIFTFYLLNFSKGQNLSTHFISSFLVSIEDIFNNTIYMRCIDYIQHNFANNIFVYVAICIFTILCIILFVASMFKQKQILQRKNYYDAPELRSLYLQASRYINILNVVIYGFIMATAPQVLYAWLGEGYSLAHTICVVIGLLCVIHLATLPCSAMMRGIDRSGRELEAILINMILFLLWSSIWTVHYDIMGIVWAFTLSTIVSSMYFLIRTNDVFTVSSHEYITICIKPAMYPALIACFIALMSSLCDFIFPNLGRLETLGIVIILGVLYLLMCGIVLWRYCLSSEECTAILETIKRKKR